uniref:Putative secreted protein n=1 Tax=Anopheles darlingi TaxID=43151 RepID=A0A2M4DIL0_ANODA
MLLVGLSPFGGFPPLCCTLILWWALPGTVSTHRVLLIRCLALVEFTSINRPVVCCLFPLQYYQKKKLHTHTRKHTHTHSHLDTPKHAHTYTRTLTHKYTPSERTSERCVCGKNLPSVVVSVAARSVCARLCTLRVTQQPLETTCTTSAIGCISPIPPTPPEKGVFQSLSKSHDRLPKSSSIGAKSKRASES